MESITAPAECPFIRNSLKASPAAQDDERKTNKSKGKNRFLGFASE
jgi:hypothetical protein